MPTDDLIRYDPVWRRIPADQYTVKLEGKFGPRVRRLDALNNWGALNWLYPHATASKLAHHWGVERNAAEFLGADPEREKYRASFRTAAHVVHWGHLPLAYQGAEAVYRAAHVDSGWRKLISDVVDETVTFGRLACAREDHPGQCAQSAKTGDDFSELYRWLAAWLVKLEWKRIYAAIGDASEDRSGLVEEDVRGALVRTLVCKDDVGFKILRRCNMADFVPRDLLQCGTAWLTVDIEALWERSPLSPQAAREWALLFAAEEYLHRRYYLAPSSLLLHSLVARAIAGGLVAKEPSRQLLREMLDPTADDNYFDKKLTSVHRTRLRDLKRDVGQKRLHDWLHVGSFQTVSVPAGSRFTIEDHLSGRSGRARLSYPFTSQLSITTEIGGTDDRPDFMAGNGRIYATVHVHRHERSKLAAPVLALLGRLQELVSPLDTAALGDSAVSWLLAARVEQRGRGVYSEAGEELLPELELLRRQMRLVRGLAGLREFEDHGYTRLLLDTLLSESFETSTELLGQTMLRLPWRGLRASAGRSILAKVRSGSLVEATKSKGQRRGAALEAAVAADQWLNPDRADHRIVLVNATSLDDDGRPSAEWDVMRIDVRKDRTWTLTAVECAVKRSAAKDAEARDKLEAVRAQVQGRFSDLARYRTLLASPANQSPKYEDAGRGFEAEP